LAHPTFGRRIGDRRNSADDAGRPIAFPLQVQAGLNRIALQRSLPAADARSAVQQD